MIRAGAALLVVVSCGGVQALPVERAARLDVAVAAVDAGGPASSAAQAPTPPPDPFLRNVTQLSVGSAHVCAVTTGHAVVCWGDNAAGQVGVGRDGHSVGESLLRPHFVGGLPDVASVAAGKMHTCALDLQGNVFCWGSAGGDLEETEGGASGSIELHGPRLGTPMQIPLGGGQGHLVALSQMTSDACVAFADEVRCWSTFQTIPIKTRTVSMPSIRTVPLAGVTALALAHGKVCGVAGSKLLCWHGNDKPTAAVWARGDAFVPASIAMGESYACATSTAGDVRCWTGLIDDFWKKAPDRVVTWPGKVPTRAVAVGDSPVCTADTGGRVDCFLSEEGGLPDQAAASSWATKSLGPHPIAGVDGAIDLGLGSGRNVFGFGFGCALRGAGQSGSRVVCWGDNESGQLGTGNSMPSMSAVQVVGAR